MTIRSLIIVACSLENLDLTTLLFVFVFIFVFVMKSTSYIHFPNRRFGKLIHVSVLGSLNFVVIWETPHLLLPFIPNSSPHKRYTDTTKNYQDNILDFYTKVWHKNQVKLAGKANS